jgi:hypothetical protein
MGQQKTDALHQHLITVPESNLSEYLGELSTAPLEEERKEPGYHRDGLVER